MKTIRITISGDKPADVVLTEKKPQAEKRKKKKSPYKKLETLFTKMERQEIS